MPRSLPDDASKRMMSPAQLQYLKDQLLAAKAAGQVAFWVSSVPYISAPVTGGGTWGGYTTQRREIANFLASNNIDNLVILSGDAHMLAADNGTNATSPTTPTLR